MVCVSAITKAKRKLGLLRLNMRWLGHLKLLLLCYGYYIQLVPTRFELEWTISKIGGGEERGGGGKDSTTYVVRSTPSKVHKLTAKKPLCKR